MTESEEDKLFRHVWEAADSLQSEAHKGDVAQAQQLSKDAEELRGKLESLQAMIDKRVWCHEQAKAALRKFHIESVANGTPAADNTEARKIVIGKTDDTDITDLTNLYAEDDDDGLQYADSRPPAPDSH
jgi:hypothetical protein